MNVPNRNRPRSLICAAALGLALLGGCGGRAPEPRSTASAGAEPAAPTVELDRLVVSGAPEKAMTVLAAKKESKHGDAVVVLGRVKDFVDGAAVFTLIDGSFNSCRDRKESCPTPWDYCCYPPDEIAPGLATVKLVGQGTEPLKSPLKGVRGIDNLTTVAVEAKAERDQAGNLVLLASRILVR